MYSKPVKQAKLETVYKTINTHSYEKYMENVNLPIR